MKLVHLNDYLNVCEQNRVEVGYRRLLIKTSNLPVEREKIYTRLFQKFTTYYEQVKDKTYTTDITEMQKSIWNGNEINNHESFFCSKLVPDTFIHIGVIEPTYLANNYNLTDFEGKNIPFVGNFRFGTLFKLYI